MKKFLMVVCVIALLAVASAAYASDNAWLISIKAVTPASAGGGAAALVGVGTTSDLTASFPASNGGATAEQSAGDATNVFHSRHDGLRDVDGQEAYEWGLKIGAKGTVPGTTLVNICIWNNATANLGAGGILNQNLAYALYSGNDLLAWFSSDLGTVKALAMAGDVGLTEGLWSNTSVLIKNATSWSPTTANMGFFVQRTVNNGAAYGDLDTYRFVAFAPQEVIVTPEPGSLMALGSGLIGLAGFAIRRRR